MYPMSNLKVDFVDELGEMLNGSVCIIRAGKPRRHTGEPSGSAATGVCGATCDDKRGASPDLMTFSPCLATELHTPVVGLGASRAKRETRRKDVRLEP